MVKTKAEVGEENFEVLHPNEKLKYDSNFLRGTIVEGLNDPLTGSISKDDTQLTKFHGTYQQDDRDLRDERRKLMTCLIASCTSLAMYFSSPQT